MGAALTGTVARSVLVPWWALKRGAGGWSPYELSVLVTLAVVVLFTPELARLPAIAVALAGIRWPHLTRWASFWFALAAIRAVGLIPWYWPTLDNHHYLITYWLLALGCAQLSPSPGRTAATAARWLIGLSFGFAAVWKLLTPDFASGSFFRYALAIDALPAPFLPPGLENEAVFEANREAVRSAALEGGDPVHLDEGPLAPVLTPLLAWWTVGIEALVAATFLAPLRGGWERLRHGGLVVFLVTTYPVAPVLAFGWILVAMGVATVRRGRTNHLLAYLAGGAVAFASAALVVYPFALMALGVFGLLAYLRTVDRRFLVTGAPLAGLSVGVAAGLPWAAAGGVAGGLAVDGTFAVMRKRPAGVSLVGALAVGAAAGVAAAWAPGTAWVGVGLGGVVAALAVAREARPAAEPSPSPAQAADAARNAADP